MKVFGQYIITKGIGEGGMGKVWRAWKISSAGFKKLVAIKTLKSPEYIQLFINEAKISANFEHENVLKTLDFGEISDTFFIAMEYIRGANLKEVMDRVNELPLDIFFFIAEKVLSAVEYIHNFGGMNLVHRDINPKNILISWVGNVKLSDFGITLPQNEKIDPFGKLSYVPPEVLTGSGWSQQGDIWSVGVMMWEMLTSQKLFRGKNPKDVREKILKKEIPPPSSINPIVPEEIDKVVLKALSRTPATRYISAEEMITDLREAVESSGIPKIYHKEFARFINSFFREKIKKEASEISYEEKKVSEFITEMKRKGAAITTYPTDNIESLTKDGENTNQNSESEDSRKQNKKENKGKSLNKRRIRRRKGKTEKDKTEGSKKGRGDDKGSGIHSGEGIGREESKLESKIAEQSSISGVERYGSEIPLGYSEPKKEQITLGNTREGEEEREENKEESERGKRKRERKKGRSSKGRKNKGIRKFSRYFLPTVFGILAGFSLGISKSMIDMRKAMESFEMGKILLKSRNFHEAEEFIKKSAELSELPELQILLSEIRKNVEIRRNAELTGRNSDFPSDTKKKER